MKNTLQEISALAIQPNGSMFTGKQKNLLWLGKNPASEEEIKSAENRLGVQLPVDYKNFLLLTNGFFTPNDSTEPTFEGIENIDFLKNIDTYLLEVWNEGVLVDVGEQLNRAIVVAGMNDEQYFFLIPPESHCDKWQYWKFANWIPGEERYENLENYFQSVLQFLKETSA
jgi:cell wall assembly regulator SMI1